MNAHEIQRRLDALKTDLERLGCTVSINMTVDGLPFAAVSKKRKAHRISEAQRAILSRIKYEGEYRYPKETPTIKALLKKGLMSGRWQPPAPGNDYGGTMVYTLTQAGRAVLEAAS